MKARGVPADPKEAGKWYWLAKAAGLNDKWLEDYMAGLPKDVQQASFAAAKERGL